jgi:hypothetical protein
VSRKLPRFYSGKCSAYLVDVTAAKVLHDGDLNVDAYGSWGGSTTSKMYYKTEGCSYQLSCLSRKGGVGVSETSPWDTVILVRYFKYPSVSLVKKVFVLKKRRDNGLTELAPGTSALICYEWRGEPQPLAVRPHGNSKKGLPYQRTYKSVLVDIKGRLANYCFHLKLFSLREATQITLAFFRAADPPPLFDANVKSGG